MSTLPRTYEEYKELIGTPELDTWGWKGIAPTVDRCSTCPEESIGTVTMEIGFTGSPLKATATFAVCAEHFQLAHEEGTLLSCFLLPEPGDHDRPDAGRES